MDDLGEACVFALEHWIPAQGELNYLNVGTGVDITIRETAELIAELVGFEGEIIYNSDQPDGTPRKLLDTSRIKKLGWEPHYSFRDGLKNAYESYLYLTRQVGNFFSITG